MATNDSGNGESDDCEELVTRLLVEYAESVPATRPLDPELSLRRDLAIESLSLVSMTLRIGEELGVDVVDMGLELGNLKTFGDLVNIGRAIKIYKAKNV